MGNSKAADIFKRMAKWQIIATSAVAVGAFYFAGLHGALSAMVGGLSAILGGWTGSLVAGRSENKKDASAILIGMLKGEGVKIIVIAALLLLTFKVYTQHLVPMAMIFGLAASAILSGAAISGLNDDTDSQSNTQTSDK